MPCNYNVGDWLAKTITNNDPNDNDRNWNIFLAGVTPQPGIRDPLTRVPLRALRKPTRTFGMLPPTEAAAMGLDPTQREHTWDWREFTTKFPAGPLTDDQLLKPFRHVQPMYPEPTKAPFSKHQSSTLISVEYGVHPRLFPNHKLDALRVGVVIPANGTYALPNRFLIYDRGTYYRPYDVERLPGDIIVSSYDALRSHPSLKGAAACLSEVLARLRVFAGLPGPGPDDPQPAILISWVNQGEATLSRRMYLTAIVLGLYRLYDLKLALWRKFDFRGPFNVVVYDHSDQKGKNFLDTLAIHGDENLMEIVIRFGRLKAIDWRGSTPNMMPEPARGIFARALVAQLFYQFLTGIGDITSPAILGTSIEAVMASWALGSRSLISGRLSLSDLLRNPCSRGYVETLRAWLACEARIRDLYPSSPMFEHKFLDVFIPVDWSTRPREDVDNDWFQYVNPGALPEPRYLKSSDPRKLALIIYNAILVQEEREKRGESDNTLAVKLGEHLAGKPQQESRQILALVLANVHRNIDMTDRTHIVQIGGLLNSPEFNASDPFEIKIAVIQNIIPHIVQRYMIRQTGEEATSLTNLSLNLSAILNRPSINIQYIINFFEYFSYREFYSIYAACDYRVERMEPASLRHSGMVLKMCDAIISYFLTYSIRLLREACAIQNLIRKFLILFSRYCFNFYLNHVSRFDGKVGVRIMTRMLEASNSGETSPLLYSDMESNWDRALRLILVAKRDHSIGHDVEELTDLSKLWTCLEVGTQCAFDQCHQALKKGRRHHCRGCGGFFCNSHIRKRLWPTPSSTAPEEAYLSSDMYICNTCITIRPAALAPAGV